MKRIFICIVALLIWGGLCALTDLNTASRAELEQLPLPPETVGAIYDYREFQGWFTDIYQLESLGLVTHPQLLTLKPLVTVNPVSEDDPVVRRREEIYYLIQRLGSGEDAQEGLADVWEDYLLTPRNLNRMSYAELLNLPNVNPPDAYAVMKRRAEGDTIADWRDLRGTEGLTYYGGTNIRSYVNYRDEAKDDRVHGDYRFRYSSKPLEEDVDDMYNEPMHDDLTHSRQCTYGGYFGTDRQDASLYHKVKLRYDQYRAGYSLYTGPYETAAWDGDDQKLWKDGKMFVSLDTNPKWTSDDKFTIIAGNYQVSWGQGLVMQNTDYYSARQTGYGFNKRVLGVIPDLSTSQEYNLRGVAVNYNNRLFNGIFFASYDQKDAYVYDYNNDGVINADDKDSDDKYHVFSLATLSTRWDNDDLQDAEAYWNTHRSRPVSLAARRDVVDEYTWGGRLEYTPVLGTRLAFSGYNTLYPNAQFVVPSGDDLREQLIYATGDYDKWKAMDSEISSMYSTLNDKHKRDYRRVLGFDGETVLGNTSFSGEYAELSVDGEDYILGDDPKAMVFSSCTQYENLNVICLYRNYDLDFDNPYARGFSEHERYDDTIFDKNPYITVNQELADLFINSAQAQPEEGFYVETRYRFSNYLTLNRTYIDLWERKSDGRKSMRLQGELDYRPLYRWGLNLKHKYQINRFDDEMDRAVSTTNETTITLFNNLSARDRISLEYRYNRVEMPPYTYLANNGEPNVDYLVQGQNLIQGDYLAMDFTHNVNDDLRFKTGIMYWNGHGVSQWDWEDIEIDFMGSNGMKVWFMITDKIANNLYLSLKYKVKRYEAKDLELRKWWNDDINTDLATGQSLYVSKFDDLQTTEHALRLQLDYKF